MNKTTALSTVIIF